MKNTLIDQILKEFDEKMQYYVNGKGEFGNTKTPKGFWLQSGMDGDIDQKVLKGFLRTSLEKAIAKTRKQCEEEKNELEMFIKMTILGLKANPNYPELANEIEQLYNKRFSQEPKGK